MFWVHFVPSTSESVNAYYKSWISPINKFTESTISLHAALCQLLSPVYQSYHLSKLMIIATKPTKEHETLFLFSCDLVGFVADYI